MLTDKPLIDSHCHIDMVLEKGISREEVDKSISEAGLSAVIQIGADPAAMEFSRNFCSQESAYRRYYTIGSHPGEAHESNWVFGIDFAKSNQFDPNFVAIGEVGLDYFYGVDTKNLQREVFEAYVELALELGKPIAIHTREAHRDTVDILKTLNGKVPILIHCFTGNRKEMDEFIEIGAYISYSGIVTFKNADSLREAATATPPERLLVETDAPFLAPVPVRGKINRPGWVRYTLEYLEKLRETELAEQVYQNTLQVFQIKP